MQMKQKPILFSGILALSIFIVSFSLKERVVGDSFVIVELYTSQGCSSCPRADKVLEQIAEEYKNKNVIPLGFHVDYWDRLGWKDTFSKQEFSLRQYVYSQRFGSSTVYTPQMIVNGVSEFNGGDKSKAFSAINKNLKTKVPVKLDGTLKNFTRKLSINYTLSSVVFDNYTVNAVLVKNKEKVSIKRGENSNKQIVYHNIVIDLQTIAANKKGTITFTKPKEYNSENYTVVLFLQENNNGPISSATKLGHS